MMKRAMDKSKVKVLNPGEWHIPLIKEEELDIPLHLKLKLSAARCARISYGMNTRITEPDMKKDLELYKRLVESDPMHASCTEHQARATSDKRFHRNHRSFNPYRVFIEGNVDITELK
ncbi:hypothetical protein MHBO_004179 [Bonamia ostreae]|uniref:Uncharacterized protein n=1 Tax=Bonamia ostreae TaxID=126728 RepID=A0ABV2ATA4_9EUKA